MNDGAVVVMHDIICYIYATNTLMYAPRLLMSAVCAEKILPVSDEARPFSNIVAFQITQDTRKYIRNVFDTLMFPWYYKDDRDVSNVYKLVKKHYLPNEISLFETAIKMSDYFPVVNLSEGLLHLKNFRELLMELKKDDNDIFNGTILYGAGHNCCNVLQLFINNNIPNNFQIWDINAVNIEKVFDKPVRLPDFESRAKPGQIMVITIENRKIADSIRTQFESLGYTVCHGINSWLKLALAFKDKKVCPICNSSDVYNLLLGTLGWRNGIMKCRNCSHGWRPNVPDLKETIETKYRDAKYWAQDKNHQGITHVEFSDEWKNWVNSRIRLLESFDLLATENPNSFSIFEFGCSEGMVLYTLKQRGFDVLGNDVCFIADEAQKKLGITILTDPIENLEINKRFDLIMSFHVFEHLIDPVSVLKKICALAKPNGKIFLHIPIGDGDEEFNNSDHYHFFSRKSLSYMMCEYTNIIKEDISNFKTINNDVYGVMSILGEVKPNNNAK